MAKLIGLMSTLFLCTLVQQASAGEDLRERFGTSSLKAGQLILRGLELLEARNPKDAKTALEEAQREDPRSLFPLYLLGEAYIQLGEVEKGIESYKRCVAVSDETKTVDVIRVDVEINLALTYCKLGQGEEGGHWFARAILDDPQNRFGKRGKAWRNLGITLNEQGRRLAAFLAIARAHKDIPEQVPNEMVRDYLKNVGNQEGAHLLKGLGEKPVEVPKREITGELSTVNITLPEVSVGQFCADLEGRFVIAFVPQESSYVYIPVGEGKATQVAVNGQVHCGCLAEGKLFLVAGQPAKLIQVEPLTGKVVDSFALEQSAGSVAVFPSLQLAYYTCGREVFGLNLKSRALSKSESLALKITAHPFYPLLYGYFKDDPKSDSYTLIVDGQPVFIQSSEMDWNQSVLWKAAVTPTALVSSDLRLNAASNAGCLAVSPDGKWVALAGGGGWRPTGWSGKLGYGVAVFNGANMEQVIGFYQTDAYPLGVSFNPVTAQVAAIREKSAHIYHLSNQANPEKVLEGKFTGVSAWSGNGEYLYLAVAPKGIAVFRNKLGPEEGKSAKTWFKKIPAYSFISSTGTVQSGNSPTSSAASPAKVSVEPLSVLQSFRLQNTAAAAKKAFEPLAQKQQRQPPPPWHLDARYAAKAELVAMLRELDRPGRQQVDNGIHIFKLKQELKKIPASDVAAVALKCYLGELHCQNKQMAEAEPLFLETVQKDAGQTDLSGRALRGLAQVCLERGESSGALFCLGHAFLLFRGDADAQALALPLLQKAGMPAEAAALEKEATAPGTSTSRNLPALPLPPETAKSLQGSDVFSAVAESVVQVKTGQGSGSGFCVARSDLILTNAHVVGESEQVTIQPFINRKGKSVKLPEVQGTVLVRMAKEDLALVQLKERVETLEPLIVAVKQPTPGSKVYALGSPGLKDQVLTQTFSEGIVSATQRELEGQKYIQHTAAVNPGNSGGPLLNEFAQVVGMVTLKAHLENVSFAVPSDVLRALFSKH